MNKTLEEYFDPLEGYFLNLTRNTQKGIYEMEVGVPKNWVYKKTKKVDVEEVVKSERGILIKISPANDDCVLDDLYEYILVVIETNKKIEEKEEEFKKSIEEVKEEIKAKTKYFYDELNKMKEISFGKFDSIDENIKTDEETKKTPVTETITVDEETPNKLVKKKRGRKPKIKLPDNEE